MPLEGKRCLEITIKPRSVGPQTLSLLYPIQIPTPLPTFRLFNSGDGKSSRILVQEALFRFMSFSCCLCKFFNSSFRVFKLLNYRKSYAFNRILKFRLLCIWFYSTVWTKLNQRNLGCRMWWDIGEKTWNAMVLNVTTFSKNTTYTTLEVL